MLVCNVSLRARRIIAVEIVEDVGAAEDLIGLAVPLMLIDEPSAATDTLSAFTGELLHEAASAADSCSVGLLHAGVIDEPAAATATTSVYAPTGYSVSITEAAAAIDAPDGTVISASVARSAMLPSAFVNSDGTAREANADGTMVNLG